MDELFAASAIALAAAGATVAVAAPQSAPGGSFASLLVLLMPSLLLTWLVRVLLRRARSWPRVQRPLGWLVAASAARAVMLGGVWLVNEVVVDAPGGPHALLGYALTLLLGVAAGKVAFGLVRRATIDGRTAVAVFVWTSGLELGVVDALWLPREHAAIHDVLLVATLASFVIGGALWASTAPQRRQLSFAALGLLGLFGGAAWRTGWHRAATAAHYTAQQKILLAAELLLAPQQLATATVAARQDARWLSAQPLREPAQPLRASAWPASESARPASGPVLPTKAGAPKVILLLTVDTFRCGFGREPFADLCPRLTQLGAEGRLRLDAHANFPLTARALTSLHTGDLLANPARDVEHPFYLASYFAQHGYRTEAVITHPNTVADRGVRASFDHVDDSLVPEATRPAGVTSDEVTDHLLAAIGEEPTFLWGHYLDPHAPYVEHAGQVLVWSQRAAYAAEMRRTDAAIGRLVDAIAARPDAAEIMLLVTADHGEEFGEHGGRNHGYALHEEVMRVPMLTWSGGADHRRHGGAVLPASTVAIAPYLSALVGAEAPAAAGPVFLRTPIAEDPQIAVLDGDWKLIVHHRLRFVELYDLGADPSEQHDLSEEQRERVRVMTSSIQAFRAALDENRTRELALAHR